MSTGRIGKRITRLEAIENAKETARKAEEAERLDRGSEWSAIEFTPFAREVLDRLENIHITIMDCYGLLKDMKDRH